MPIRLVPCVKADSAVEARRYSIAMVEHLPPKVGCVVPIRGKHEKNAMLRERSHTHSCDE